MLAKTLADFYERDLRKLVDELNSFKDESNLWKTHGSIRNAAGNLALHIVGGSSYLIGNKLANTGYVRHRDQEFTIKGVERKIITLQLEALILVVTSTIGPMSQEKLDADYPIPFDDAIRTNSYVLVQLLAHLNYHLGQVNYLRRALEP